VHPWKYTYATHKRIRKKLKKLCYKVNDSLDGEKEDEPNRPRLLITHMKILPLNNLR